MRKYLQIETTSLEGQRKTKENIDGLSQICGREEEGEMVKF